MALTEPSPDGNLLLYGVAASGSDWQEFKIRRVTDGVDLSDHLRWIKFSGAAWTRDGKGFFYSRYPEPRTGEAMVGQNRDMKVYYHRIGTVQTDDVLVYERLDQPDWGFGVHVTHDGRYLVMAVWVGTDTRQRIHYLDLVDPLLPKVTGTVVRLLDHADAGQAAAPRADEWHDDGAAAAGARPGGSVRQPAAPALPAPDAGRECTVARAVFARLGARGFCTGAAGRAG